MGYINVYDDAEYTHLGNGWYSYPLSNSSPHPMYLYPSPPPPSHYPNVSATLNEIPKKKKEEKKMRHLYSIIVVNPRTDKVEGPIYVVAEDESQALLKASLPQEVRSSPEKYDIIVDEIGDVRERRQTQKVKVVREDDEE